MKKPREASCDDDQTFDNQPPSGESTPSKKKRGRPRKTTRESTSSAGMGADDDSSQNIDIKDELEISDDDVDMDTSGGGGGGGMEEEALHPEMEEVQEGNEWLDVDDTAAHGGFTPFPMGNPNPINPALLASIRVAEETVVDEDYDPTDFLQNLGKPQVYHTQPDAEEEPQQVQKVTKN